MEDKELPLVSIRCITYNHEPYIRQCLESFVMQKTNFRFEAIVHDDASTDGTVAIVREYAEKYPNIIKPIYETENQYSKHDGSLRRAVDVHIRGKYVALCEGDDYWIDPLKLQKQVNFMESHPNHSLCFHANKILYPDNKIKDNYRYKEEVIECPMKDIILGGGGYMATNSMLYRKESLIYPYPEWASKCPVGDLPLMLLLSINGKVCYLNEIMSCYRQLSSGSWSNTMSSSYKLQVVHNKKIKTMWRGFDSYTKKQYHAIVQNKIRQNNISLIRNGIFLLIHNI